MKSEETGLLDLLDRFNTDDKARLHLEEIRWANGIVCPRCQCADQSKFSTIKANAEKKVRAGLHYCANCKKQFTVTIGTVFEGTHIPLRKWVIAWYLLCASKKGMSSLQLQRMLKLGSYRTALFLTHRIRYALSNEAFTTKLQGDVEVDETYIGGKAKFQHRFDAKTNTLLTKFHNKTAVVSIVERGGNKRSFVSQRVTGKNVLAAISEHVDAAARVHTDGSPLYPKVKRTHQHHVVDHSKRQYALKCDGFTAHTNTVESSFSLLKRGVYGTFHSVSRKHLPLYMAEFDHRWNYRKSSDGERTIAGLKTVEGKRLKYKNLVNKRK